VYFGTSWSPAGEWVLYQDCHYKQDLSALSAIDEIGGDKLGDVAPSYVEDGLSKG
jgi:hypothetical protein